MGDEPGARATTAGAAAVFLVPVVALGVVAALHLARSLDDNRLTSWRWVFADGPLRLYALTALGLLLAQLLARLPLPGRRPAAFLFFAALAAGACFQGAPEAIVDASRYFAQAKHLAVYGPASFLAEWGRGIPAWTDLPLVPLLDGLAFRAFGESREVVQALRTLYLAGAVALTCDLGRALWDEEVGFAAGAFLLAIPYLMTQVPAMLVDVPAMFFLALALRATVAALQHGGAARVLLAALATTLALLSKYSAWLLATSLPVAWLVLRRSGAPRAGLAALAIAGALVAAALAPIRTVVAEQLALLIGYQAPGLRRWGESFASTFLFQVHPFLTAAALLALGLAIRRRDGKVLVVLWPVLLLLVLRVERIRYWIPAFPMLATLGGYGLRALRSPERRLVLWSAVVSALVVAGGGYLPFLERTSAANLEEAGAWLDALDGEAAEVFTPAPDDAEVNPAVSVPLLDLHTRKRLVYRYEAAPPPPGHETSPLRFTWAYRNPEYYEGRGEAPAATIVVTDDLSRPLPAGLAARLRGRRPDRVFAADEGVFRHRTLVAVYR